MRIPIVTGLTVLVLVACGDGEQSVPAVIVGMGGGSAIGNSGGNPGVGSFVTSTGGAANSAVASGGNGASDTGAAPGIGGASGSVTPSSGGASGSLQSATGGLDGVGGTSSTTAPTGGTSSSGAGTGGRSGLGSGGVAAATGGRFGFGTGGRSGFGSGGSNPGAGGTMASGGATATGGAGSDVCSDPGTTHSGGTQYCSSSTGAMSNGYHYEYWTAGSGSACMTVFGDEATFKCNWSSSGDFLARVGLRYNETQKPDQIGTFGSDFAITGSGSGLVYIGIYGWTNNPLIEYYIIEDWVNSTWNSAPSIGTNKGTIEVDGGTYTLYQNTRTGASIHGNTTFTQYYSIRTVGRNCGHISISEHFAKWAEKGMTLGNLYEVKLLVEGMNNGSGNYEFTKATVVVE